MLDLSRVTLFAIHVAFDKTKTVAEIDRDKLEKKFKKEKEIKLN